MSSSFPSLFSIDAVEIMRAKVQLVGITFYNVCGMVNNWNICRNVWRLKISTFVEQNLKRFSDESICIPGAGCAVCRDG